MFFFPPPAIPPSSFFPIRRTHYNIKFSSIIAKLERPLALKLHDSRERDYTGRVISIPVAAVLYFFYTFLLFFPLFPPYRTRRIRVIRVVTPRRDDAFNGILGTRKKKNNRNTSRSDNSLERWSLNRKIKRRRQMSKRKSYIG